MFGTPAVISPVIVWLLDLLPWSAQLREKRKRKVTHCGSDYRRTLSRTRPPPTRNEPAPKSPSEAALCIFFGRRRLPRPLLYSTMKQHPRDPARQCLCIDRWGDGTYGGEEVLHNSGVQGIKLPQPSRPPSHRRIPSLLFFSLAGILVK